MMKRSDKLDAVRDLVELRLSPSEALARLREFEADSHLDAIVFKTDDVAFALNEHCAGRLSSEYIVEWAEAIVGLDEITLDPDNRDDLAQMLFEISTPELFGSVGEVVKDVQKRLGLLHE